MRNLDIGDMEHKSAPITAFGPGIWAPFELSETIPKDFETPVLTTATQDFLSTLCFPLYVTDGLPTSFVFQQLL